MDRPPHDPLDIFGDRRQAARHGAVQECQGLFRGIVAVDLGVAKAVSRTHESQDRLGIGHDHGVGGQEIAGPFGDQSAFLVAVDATRLMNSASAQVIRSTRRSWARLREPEGPGDGAPSASRGCLPRPVR